MNVRIIAGIVSLCLLITCGCTKVKYVKTKEIEQIPQTRTVPIQARVLFDGGDVTSPTASRHAVTADLMESHLVEKTSFDVRTSTGNRRGGGTKKPLVLFHGHVGPPGEAGTSVFTYRAFEPSGEILVIGSVEGEWPGIIEVRMDSLLQQEVMQKQEVTFKSVLEREVVRTKEMKVPDPRGTNMLILLGSVVVLGIGLDLYAAI